LLVVGVAIACTAAVVGYVGWAARRASASTDAATVAELRQITSRPFIAFLASDSGKPPYRQLAVAPLDRLGERLFVGMSCDRLSMTGAIGVCVTHKVGGFSLTYDVHTFDRTFQPKGDSAAGYGLPSRIRISGSGEVAAVTSFITGHAYETPGGFSTLTEIFRPGSKDAVVSNLEQLHVVRAGKRFEPSNRNFWGVTFADNDSFYATMGTGPDTYLVRGDLNTRTLTTVHRNAECPSLSPDHTRVAFKRRLPNGKWHFTVLELATGKTTDLAERRSIDDQLAWADNDHLLYGTREGIWSARADGNGAPRLLVPGGASPAVVQ
jgi:hypothetical protein